MQDVLQSLERHTVCTGTRCFEDVADAFGNPIVPQSQMSTNMMFMGFMMMMMMAAMFLRMNRPATDTVDAKPRIQEMGPDDHGPDHEPPPPSIH